VVPGTADGVLYQDPFGERTVVVGAFGADREQLVTTARQQHRAARDVPQDHAVFSDIRKRHPLGKVGSVEPLLLFAHGWLLTYDGWKISQRRRRDPVLPIRTITVEGRRHFEPEKVNLSRGSYLRPKPPEPDFSPRVLLVEGRAAFADILRWNLQRSGFVVEHVG
jgi:hypothetical protein